MHRDADSDVFLLFGCMCHASHASGCLRRVLSPLPRIHLPVDDLLERFVHLRPHDLERRRQAAVVLGELDGEHGELPYRFGA